MTEIKNKDENISEVDGIKLEDAMRKLDEVVAKLEKENTELEEALKLYEEGVRLVAVCNQKLTDAERKIRILKINPDGEICEEPFENT